MGRILPVWIASAIVVATAWVALPASAAPPADGSFAITSSTAVTAQRAAGAPTRSARQFVDARPGLTGAARTGSDLVQRSVTPLVGGGTSVRFQQRIRGVPVLGAETMVATDADGRVTGASGEQLTGPTPRLDPTVDPASARAIARQAAARQESSSPWDITADDPELVVFDPRIIGTPAPFGSYLAWSVITVDQRSGMEHRVLVNARSGGAYVIPRTASALDRRVCDASSTANFFPCLAANAARKGSEGPVADADVNAAYDYAGDTYDFFFQRFGRDSMDGQGMPIVTTVNYCPTGQPCPYRNAFWSSGAGQTAYGTGLVVDDVVAHEITHGVTSYTADLFYSYQSGAINEALSDIFGEFVDLVNGRGTDTAATRWIVGEDQVVFPGGLRNMADPTAFGDPDSTQSALWSAADPTSASWDNGGVHSNSGVGNKAAQLMTDGGTHRGQVVTGIGIDKTALIFYRALTAGLRSGSNYADLDAVLEQSCTDLIGTGAISAADCQQVRNARLAVSMADAPRLAPTPRATVCATGTRASLLYDDIESGGGNWTTSDPAIGMITFGYAASASQSLYLDTPASSVDAHLALARTDVVLPAGAYLRFDHAYLFDAAYGPARLYDGGVVEIRARSGSTWSAWTDAGPLIDPERGYSGPLEAGNPLAGRQAFGGVSRGYGSTRLDLSSYAGRSVQVRFRVATNGSVGDVGWVIDNVDIYSCATPVVPLPPATASPQQAAPVAQVAQAAPAPCAGTAGMARARCTSAVARSAGIARARAALVRQLAACGKRPVAARARCRAIAGADHALAVAKARAQATRTVALARCATRPRAKRAACRNGASAAYRSRVAKATAARARALR